MTANAFAEDVQAASGVEGSIEMKNAPGQFSWGIFYKLFIFEIVVIIINFFGAKVFAFGGGKNEEPPI